MINVLADKHLFRLAELMPAECNLTLFDPGDGVPEITEGTQALLTRTVTRIDAESLPALPDSLSFVGTGSAGTDHVDESFLHSRGITFASAGGCNARSVAEYVAVALLLWAERRDRSLADCRVGIIGMGHTGRAVSTLLEALDIAYAAYDPPRAEREDAFASVSLEEVLACDILTFHTPLTQHGDYPTRHWLDKPKMERRSFELIINASRGGVIDETAVMRGLEAGSVGDVVLDVWENEPLFDDTIARHAFLKTPHIAGYSVEAKTRATRMVVQAMARHFTIDYKTEASQDEAHFRKPPSTFWSLSDVLTFYHPIRDYETRLLMLIGRSRQEKGKGFSEIRTGHPLRHEFPHLHIPQSLKAEYPALEALSSVASASP